jgi:hypothetical protein
MRSPRRLLAVLLAVAAGHPGSLVAQVAGMPVRNAGIGTGVSIAADVAFPNATLGKGTALGATVAAGFGPLGVTASVSNWKPVSATERFTSIGASGNLKIIGGPLIPLSVTLQAGAARWAPPTTTIEGDPVDLTIWHFPVGLGLTLTIPNPVFAIKPWIAPRLDLTRTTIEADTPAESHTETDFGISGGVDLGFLNGLSIRAMYDRIFLGNGVHASTLSFGLGLRVGT